MEQWMRDGRQLLYERWQKQSGVVGGKSAPEQVKDVDEKVLKAVLEIFKRSRLHACVSSRLLQKPNCRLMTSNSSNEELEFKFACGQYFPGIDRSGFFGLVQRNISSFKNPVENANTISNNDQNNSIISSSPKPHARVLIDYCWIYQNRIYDFTTDFTFIAGAGVVPQALEEAVLYCLRARPLAVEAIYEASSSGAEVNDENNSASQLTENSTILDSMDEFLCDSEFAFRDEGTKLPASDLGVTFDEKTGRVITVKASDDPMVIPSDATVGLFIKVRKYCNAVSASRHIEIAEKLKTKGNQILTGKQEDEKNNTQQEAKEPKSVRARRWYERAMMELSPEALRLSNEKGGEMTMKEMEQNVQNLLASLTHNISFCFYEQASVVVDEDGNNKSSLVNKRDLWKKSIRFASEAIKASGNKHTKSIFRRAAANAQLGNFEEAEEDLKLMQSVSESAARDPAVIGLRQSIRDQIKKSDNELKQAMNKEFNR